MRKRAMIESECKGLRCSLLLLLLRSECKQYGMKTEGAGALLAGALLAAALLAGALLAGALLACTALHRQLSAGFPHVEINLRLE